jgi:hypothetical protein
VCVCKPRTWNPTKTKNSLTQLSSQATNINTVPDRRFSDSEDDGDTNRDEFESAVDDDVERRDSRSNKRARDEPSSGVGYRVRHRVRIRQRKKVFTPSTQTPAVVVANVVDDDLAASPVASQATASQAIVSQAIAPTAIASRATASRPIATQLSAASVPCGDLVASQALASPPSPAPVDAADADAHQRSKRQRRAPVHYSPPASQTDSQRRNTYRKRKEWRDERDGEDDEETNHRKSANQGKDRRRRASESVEETQHRLAAVRDRAQRQRDSETPVERDARNAERRRQRVSAATLRADLAALDKLWELDDASSEVCSDDGGGDDGGARADDGGDDDNALINVNDDDNGMADVIDDDGGGVGVVGDDDGGDDGNGDVDDDNGGGAAPGNVGDVAGGDAELPVDENDARPRLADQARGEPFPTPPSAELKEAAFRAFTKSMSGDDALTYPCASCERLMPRATTSLKELSWPGFAHLTQSSSLPPVLATYYDLSRPGVNALPPHLVLSPWGLATDDHTHATPECATHAHVCAQCRNALSAGRLPFARSPTISRSARCPRCCAYSRPPSRTASH